MVRIRVNAVSIEAAVRRDLAPEVRREELADLARRGLKDTPFFTTGVLTMPFASGSEVRVAYIAETVMGTTPTTTPIFRTARVTSGNLNTEKAVGTSDERRLDRNVADEYLLGKDLSGSYDFELSYGSFDDFLEAALCGTWTTNVLKNGVTRRSFTFEEMLELGTTDSFSRYRGCQVDSLSMNFTAREKVTGSMGIVGVEETLSTAILTGATYTAANTNPVLTASAHASGLSISGVTAPKLRNVSFEVANGIRGRSEIGTPFPNADLGIYRFDCTGSFEAYFEDNAIYQRVLDHGSAALAITIGAAAGSRYTFTFPRIIFGNGSRPVGGSDDDVVVTVPWRAVFDPATSCSMQITRAV